MLTKLGVYLEEQPVRKPVRCVSASGEEFVVMPARDYTLLTGIDAAALPMADIFDTLGEAEDENRFKNASVPQQTESGAGAALLAGISLDDEIGIDDLPL